MSKIRVSPRPSITRLVGQAEMSHPEMIHLSNLVLGPSKDVLQGKRKLNISKETPEQLLWGDLNYQIIRYEAEQGHNPTEFETARGVRTVGVRLSCGHMTSVRSFRYLAQGGIELTNQKIKDYLDSSGLKYSGAYELE
jgi:hypothetical protein